MYSLDELSKLSKRIKVAEYPSFIRFKHLNGCLTHYITEISMIHIEVETTLIDYLENENLMLYVYGNPQEPITQIFSPNTFNPIYRMRGFIDGLSDGEEFLFKNELVKNNKYYILI